MKFRSIAILLIILTIMVGVILIFILPGINNQESHQKADKLYNDGETCYLDNDYVCATDRYQKAIAIYGQDSLYYIALAQLQVKQGNYSGAIRNYQKAKTINPSNEDILPEMNNVISQQATKTAFYLPLPDNSTPAVSIGKAGAASTPLPEAVYPIFDEGFGIVKSVIPVSESPNDSIKSEIVGGEAFSGNRSLLVSWNKYSQHWASIVLSFDSNNDPNRAAAGQMASINLNPPANYAIQFFIKRARPIESTMYLNDLTTDSITLKFQDQNILIKESLGNQAVYIYKLFPDSRDTMVDGRLPLATTGWQGFCLPLAKFDTDYWVKDKYKSFTPKDRLFDWSNVKQINIDANFYSEEGAVYLDAIRIIHASDCIPYP